MNNNNFFTLLFQSVFKDSSLSYANAINKLCLNSDKGNNKNSKIITKIINEFNEDPNKYLSFRESLMDISSVNNLLLSKHHSIDSFANGAVFLLSPDTVAIVSKSFDNFVTASRSHNLEVFEMADSRPHVLDVINSANLFVESELA